MDTELELKLVADGDVLHAIKTAVLPAIKARVKATHFTLYNQYFDSPSRYLRRNDIGFRVRSKDGKFEQTVKTSGTVVGGLHTRPEYNVELDNGHPDLSLFDDDIWPHDCDVSDLQKKIQPLFSTDFSRDEFELDFDVHGVIELVVDQGMVCAQKQKYPISEIELELKQGQVSLLFDVAEIIVRSMPVRVGNLSKAARGYMLAEDRLLEDKEMEAYLTVEQKTTCEQGFIKAAEYALEYWQHHEQCFMQDGKIRHLTRMLSGMRLLLQAIVLYLPLLQCQALLDLHKKLMEKVSQWLWLEQVESLKELSSVKGPYRKKLGRNDELLSYLRGVREGLMKAHNPKQLIAEGDNTLLQLSLSRILHEKPWQNESTGFDSRISEHAKGWLSQGWHNVMQGLPKGKSLTVQEYLAQQMMLRQNLHNGFLLSKLFDQHLDESRERFRAPWLDILNGIAELKTLTILQQQLESADIEDSDVLLRWCEEKMQTLLEVMEQSRMVASEAEAYW